MSMSLRLSDDAVRGSVYSPSEEALEALQRGDIQALIASHRDRFGGWKMEGDDHSDDDDDDDDSEDGDDDDEDDDEDSDDEDEDSPEGKKSKKSGAKHDDSPEGLKRKVAALEDEKNRLFRGRKRAREERDEARRELQKVKDEGQGDDQLKKQVGDLESQVTTLTDDLRSARLQVAFLSDNTHEWVNPSQALKLADLSEVEIDDDGKVHGLVAAMESLATDSPHLLKQKRRVTAPKEGSSGAPPKKKSASKAQAERQKIADKYRISR